MTLRRVLMALVLFLAALLGLQYGLLDGWRAERLAAIGAGVETEGTAERPSPQDGLDALSMPDPGDAREFVERPLFTPARRPWLEEVEEIAPAEVDPEPEAEPEMLRATLRSVVFGPQGREVWLEPEGEETPVRLRAGERLDGWRLTRIEAQQAIFESGEHTARLKLRPRSEGHHEVTRVLPQDPPVPLP